MKSKPENKGTVLVLGEEGRKRMRRILKRMKEKSTLPVCAQRTSMRRKL